jgi:subtilase family serine protease
MSPAAKLEGMTVVFSRTQAQEAALQALLTAQQTPGSSEYHQWLTPDQFGAQFGMADSDITKVESWLQQQGFAVTGVSRSRSRIKFSGSVGQIETAFGTEMHTYKIGSESHFAPSSDISVPAALLGSVRTVANLSDFRPHSHVRVGPPQAVHGSFTSGQTGNHYLSPKDVDTIYDINPAYSAGYTGTGQTIAIVGQSAVVTTDITNFQSAAGLTNKNPTIVQVPNSGASTVYTGDELESDLDLEYSGAMAPGATIDFVYVGSDTNLSALDALEYAVDQHVATIISSSYGDCEYDVGSTGYASFNTQVLEQAAAQGQTVIAAAGDDGSTDCYADTNLTTTQRTALGVDFPGSSQYVTSVGGTEFSAANVAAGNTTYWTAASGSTDSIESAVSYIPEGVWNDDAQGGGLSSGGGGASLYTAQPTWQTKVAGIPAGSNRTVPDIALDASPYNAGYLYCTSDTTGWSSGQVASCNNGFRDSSTQDLTVAGGTSFAAPIFAGMVAVLNQARGFTAGQGVVNNTLYGLASNSANYASAFHDITTGSNECTAGGTYCAGVGETEYAAGVGYDEASGLGSVDLYHMLTLWPDVAGSSALASTTTVIAATATVAPNTNDLVTITVAPAAGDTIATTPTGTVTLTVGTTTVAPITLSANGTATYTFTEPTAGAYEVTAAYSGDANYATSQGQYLVTVAGATAPSTTPGFALTATNVTVAAGATGTSTVTIAPANGYAGTVDWSAVTSVPSLLEGCYSIANTAVSGTAPVAATLTVYTDSSQCTAATTTASVVTANVKRRFAVRAPAAGVSAVTPAKAPFGPMPMGVAFAGLLAVGFIGRRSRGIRLLMVAGLFAVLGLGMSGCGGSSSSTASGSGTDATAGVYDLTLTGTDSANTAITASIATSNPIVVTVTSTSTTTASAVTATAGN